MKKHLSTIILFIAFFVGLAVLLYPAISNYVNGVGASYAVNNYDRALNDVSKEQNQRLLEEAAAYNERLAQRPMRFENGEPKDEEYQSLLNVTEDGMMGYITIKRLGIMLPIYHGTAESVLSKSTGHLEGTSLPIGGESTHSMITGHRGLPAAKLFTDLDKLQEGDEFTITVLNQTLTYEVDQIRIVLPEETENLGITSGNDYVTLVTCTPYAVNTHRLLVRGFRTETPIQLRVEADAVQIEPSIVAPMVAVPMITILFISLLFGSGRRRRRRRILEKSRKNGGNQ